MSNFKILIAVAFTCALLAAFALPVLAVTYKSGVTVGQYVKYGNFVGTGPGFESFGDYGSLTLQVTNVAGNQVTLLSTGQFKNGTATPGNGTVSVWDVATGTDNGSPSTQGPIISANLNAGNAIPPAGTYSVNSTENRQYLGLTRTVNTLSVTISTPDYNSSLTYVYDKASGMLLESSSLTTVQGESGPVVSEFSYSVTETNIFNSTQTPTPTPTNPTSAIPIEPLALVAIVVVAMIVIVAVVLLRKESTGK